MKPLVYVAAPYSSDPVHNTREAIEAGADLYATGLVVPLVPHLSMLSDLVRPAPVDHWYRFDLDLLEHCHAVLRLPGKSAGADREVYRAFCLRIPTFTEVEPLLAWAKAWDPAAEGVASGR